MNQTTKRYRTGKVLPAVQALCAAQGTSTGSSAPATSASSSSAAQSSGPATSATLPITSSGPMTTSWSSIPCGTTSVPHNNQTTSTTVPIAGAAGLSVGFAAAALAVLAL